jgi:PLP dependent protein
MSACADGVDPARREAQLADALSAVHARLKDAATAAGRNPSEIELLPITKFFPATDVAILRRLGCQSFGESREQEAVAKAAEVAALIGRPVRWHMVGMIQRNKARSIANWAYAVHSVSSEKVVTALARHAGRALDEGAREQPLRVYVQINLDGDVPSQAGGGPSGSSATRGGIDIGKPEEIDQICAQVASAEGLELVGLMGIPPLGSDPDEGFARLAAEHRRVLRSHPRAVSLSAGMSADLEIAVKHGSTCVRVGTALLGQRPLTSP